MTDLELMTLHADVCFTYEARGRMLLTNEPFADARRPAPRLWLGRTASGNVARIGASVPDEIAARLTAIVDNLPPAAAASLPEQTVTAIHAALTEQAPVTAEHDGLAFHFPETIPWPAGVVPLTAANRGLAYDPIAWLNDEIDDWQPCFAVVRDEAAVSVCYSSRIGSQAAEAGVDTLDGYRGHGYATAVTLAWGAAIRASGREPIYSCAGDNLASQGVARRCGLTLFGADRVWH